MTHPPLNPNLDLLRESPTRRIDAIREKLSKEGRDIILLSTGQPSIPPPPCTRNYLRDLLLEESMKLYSYTVSYGIASLREAISEDIVWLGGPRVDPDQILVTAGGQEAMYVVLASILKQGDEVLVFEPMYFGYWPLLEYFGAKTVVVKTRLEEGFQPPIDSVHEVIKRNKTKAIIVVTPDNPTGRVLEKNVAKALAEIAVDSKAWLIVDEAYKTLIYEGEHIWFYDYAPENTLSVNTFSKDPGIPGWRLGYVYGPLDAIKKLRLLNEELVYCPPSIAQYMVEYYLRDTACKKIHRERVVKVYNEKRRVLLEALREYLEAAKYLPPQGSMFALVDVAEYLRREGKDSEWLAKKLLEDASVAVVPGVFFGETARYSIRISFVTETKERIKEGVKRIRNVLEKS